MVVIVDGDQINWPDWVSTFMSSFFSVSPGSGSEKVNLKRGLRTKVDVNVGTRLIEGFISERTLFF